MAGILIPSYAGGFARNAAEARFPELRRGLVGAWQMFLGPTGLMLRDISGHHNLGTPPDAASMPSWVTTQMGHALDFDGNDDYINVDGTGSQDPDQLTISVWVKLTALDGMIYAHRSEETRLIQLYAQSTSEIRFQLRSSGNALKEIISTDFDLTKWHHIVGVFDNINNNHVLYVDGQVAGVDTTDFGAETFTSTKQIIGAYYHTFYTGHLNGTIGNISIYGRAPSPQEIALLTARPYALAELREVRHAFSIHGLTLDWTPPTSSDLKHHAIYRGDEGNPVELSAAPHATDVTPPWSEDVSGLTGRYEYLVRAVDDDDQEEGNLSEMVAVDLSSGTLVQRPNEPVIAAAVAIAAGEVELAGFYDRTGEVGVATQIRLYVNNGAGGAIDWNTPVGTAILASGLTYQAVTVESSGLTGALTYRCGIRARTAAGVEDANEEYEEVTTDAAAPSAPTLSTEVV